MSQPQTGSLQDSEGHGGLGRLERYLDDLVTDQAQLTVCLNNALARPAEQRNPFAMDLPDLLADLEFEIRRTRAERDALEGRFDDDVESLPPVPPFDSLDESHTAEPPTIAWEDTGGFLPWEAYRLPAERVPWIVDRLLPRTFVDMSGSKGSGKTLFTAHMAAAVATGARECLGRPVHVHGKVFIVASDVGEEAAWYKRMAHYEALYGRRPDVCIALPRPGIQWWSEVGRKVQQERPVLVVVDHCAGMLREMGKQADLNSAADAELLLWPLTQIVRAGAAVLMLGHSSAPQVYNGKTVGGGKRTMGSIQWGATTRQSIHLDHGGPNTLKVAVSGRSIAPFDMILDVEYDEESRTARYEVVQEEAKRDKRPRGKEIVDNRAIWAREHIIGNPALKDAPTKADVARVLVDRDGETLTESGMKSKVRRGLSHLPNAQYVPGEGWREVDA